MIAIPYVEDVYLSHSFILGLDYEPDKTNEEIRNEYHTRMRYQIFTSVCVCVSLLLDSKGFQQLVGKWIQNGKKTRLEISLVDVKTSPCDFFPELLSLFVST